MCSAQYASRSIGGFDDAARLTVEGWTPWGNLPANDNVPVGEQRARIQGDPAYQEFERLANEQDVDHASPSVTGPWEKRRGDWLQTYTGRKFWPLDPRSDEIHIEDIAHALSMQCRYGGHSMQFYSVAEHSVHIYRWLAAGNYAPNVRLAGLLHDATEAYVADVPRPLKRHLAGYKDAEALVWRAVAKRFGLVGYEDDLPAIVHEGDNRILGDEVARLMVPMDWHAKHDDPIGAEIECWPPQRSEAEFLRAFYRCERLRETAHG